MGKTYRRNKNDGPKKSAYKRNKKIRFKENFLDKTEEPSPYSEFEEDQDVEKFDNEKRK